MHIEATWRHRHLTLIFSVLLAVRVEAICNEICRNVCEIERYDFCVVIDGRRRIVQKLNVRLDEIVAQRKLVTARASIDCHRFY